MIYTIIGINAVLAAAAYKKRSLSRSGGVLGALIGAGIWIAGGLLFWGLLAFFFVSSSLFSRLGALKKRGLAAMHAKDGRRDGIQVLANAGLALASALLYGLTSNPLFAFIFGAVLAASTADTWASEIGYLSRTRPVSIRTGRPVEPGVSGGITLLGTLTASAGALTVGLLFALTSWSSGFSHPLPESLLIVSVSGFAASLVDSFLGATVQAHYIHHERRLVTERRTLEGRELPIYRGLPWITNDTVNALSGLSAACISSTLYLVYLA